MLFHFASIVVGFIALIKGADWLVGGGASLAKKFSIPNIVIGLTIVAFGTSAPELIVNLLASLSGSTDIATANIVGSNIANIFLILGVSSVIYPLTVKNNTVWKEIPLALLAVVSILIMGNDTAIDGMSFNLLTRSEGLMLLAFFVVFLYYTFGISKTDTTGEEEDVAEYSLSWSLGSIVLGLICLVLGGKWVVDSSTAMATMMGISQNLIGLTIVAVGTSLPELATSVVAAYRKQSDIAIGNVIGSNIFNVFWILGLSSTINPLPVNTATSQDIIVSIGASFLLFIFCFIGKKHVLERWQGGLFLVLYAVYIAAITFRG